MRWPRRRRTPAASPGPRTSTRLDRRDHSLGQRILVQRVVHGLDGLPERRDVVRGRVDEWTPARHTRTAPSSPPRRGAPTAAGSRHRWRCGAPPERRRELVERVLTHEHDDRARPQHDVRGEDDPPPVPVVRDRFDLLLDAIHLVQRRALERRRHGGGARLANVCSATHDGLKPIRWPAKSAGLVADVTGPATGASGPGRTPSATRSSDSTPAAISPSAGSAALRWRSKLSIRRGALSASNAVMPSACHARAPTSPSVTRPDITSATVFDSRPSTFGSSRAQRSANPSSVARPHPRTPAGLRPAARPSSMSKGPEPARRPGSARRRHCTPRGRQARATAPTYPPI